jgi:YHS domain-containing protein
MLKRTALAMFLLGNMAVTAFAGEQYVDGTGFAASGYDVVSYFDLPQSAVGEAQQSPLAGSKAIVADYNGAQFAFATEANRDRFLANPEQFVPQYDGHCAYGVAQGGKVPGNPTLWRIVDGKLYLNITRNVVGFWESDIPGNISTAENNWGGLELAEASDAVIPSFKSAAPVAN